MGFGQELRVLVICNKGSAKVSQQWLAWLQQLDLRRKTLGSSTVNKDSKRGEGHSISYFVLCVKAQ